MTYSAIVQLQCFVNISKYSLIEQTNRRALATNEWLRVRECEGVYAIGDCATVSQRKIMVCVMCRAFNSYLQTKPIVLAFQPDSL
jgi:NADH:ubiquinone reductase (non-electrogenic)